MRAPLSLNSPSIQPSDFCQSTNQKIPSQLLGYVSRLRRGLSISCHPVIVLPAPIQPLPLFYQSHCLCVCLQQFFVHLDISPFSVLDVADVLSSVPSVCGVFVKTKSCTVTDGMPVSQPLCLPPLLPGIRSVSLLPPATVMDPGQPPNDQARNMAPSLLHQTSPYTHPAI